MTTTRREFLKFLGLGAAATALAPRRLLGEAAPAAPAAGKFNVLFIAIDDLRPQMGCYGDTVVRTPNMDRLAASGLLFTSAYVQQALCSPSRTSLLTGLRPDTTGITSIGPHFRERSPNVVTLPQHFKNHGYVTRGIGKIYHDGLDDPPSWTAPHENTTVSGYTPEGAAKQRERVAAAKARGVDLSIKNNVPYGPAYEWPDCPDNGLKDGANADRALEILREIKDKPFFFAVGFSKPHIPYVAPKKYWDMYDAAKLPLPANQYPPKDAPPWACQGLVEVQRYDLIPHVDPLPEEIKRRLLHGYLACASYIDAQVGRLLDELKRLGLADKTIVILWGDHGYQLGEHAMWASKHTNYETSVRAPLMIRVPGKPDGKKSAALVEFVDMYPSLADLCGLPVPAAAEGTSFAPLLETPGRPWKKAAFSQYHRGGYKGYSIRTGRWRLVEWTKPKGGAEPVYELYDEQADPQENVNLAGRPEHAATVKELAAMLKAGWKAARPA